MTDRTDLPYAGLTTESLATALTALGVDIGPGPDNPGNVLRPEEAPEFLGVLACLVNGYTGIITQAGITSHERAMWVQGYLAASRQGEAGTSTEQTVAGTIGTALSAEAEALKAALPTSMPARLAADVLRLGATLTLFAGAIDDPELADVEAESPRIRGMLADLRERLSEVRAALGPVERDLRERGYEL